MSFTLNEIRDNLGARTKPKLLGRGIASGLGKTSGKGGKGQTARFKKKNIVYSGSSCGLPSRYLYPIAWY